MLSLTGSSIAGCVFLLWGDSLEKSVNSEFPDSEGFFAVVSAGEIAALACKDGSSGAAIAHYYGTTPFASATETTAIRRSRCQTRQAQALQAKKAAELLTGVGEIGSTRAIRADVGLAVSG
jgi:hypothetical protein